MDDYDRRQGPVDYNRAYTPPRVRSEEHTSELQSRGHLVCRLLLEKKNNDDTISRSKAKVIAGSANNQLLEERHGKDLQDKGIIYAPHDVINSGGGINVVEGRKW